MKNTKPTLGVVAISYNEEKDLPGFLDNLVHWVDEIVIIDDGSTDKTPEIVAEYSDKVTFIVSPRGEENSFSHQRNKGIEAAQSDWLLHMDIDERVPRSLAQEMLQAIDNNEYDAYRYRRLNYFLHRPMRGGGWQDWNKPQLARRGKHHFEKPVHEACVIDHGEDRIGQLQNRMWHLNDESYNERMNKSLVYCHEQARRLRNRGIRIRWWHFLLLPAYDFSRKYFLKLGFRDGVPGLLFSIHASCAMFKACALLWDEQNRIPRDHLDAKLSAEWDND